MIEIKDKKKCCGCTACASICPKHCISMVVNNEGFVYPMVDSNLCTKCNLCESVCPVIHSDICKCNNYELQGYIVRDKRNDIVADSTSGGFFTILAELIIDKNGFVYGAAFDENFVVKHIRVNNRTELNRIRGSKYVQSDIIGVFTQVEKDLKNNRIVLFTGTPCQITGLKSFLQKDYDKLITMDVVCRGVPSPLFWEKHLEHQKKKHKSNIKFIRIRNKTYGYHSGTMLIEFENGKKIYESARTNGYLKSFFSDVCSKPHCYHCSFKHEEHCSDFTVYDAWHAADLANIKDDDKGWTNVIIQSKQGAKIFDLIKSKYEYYPVEYEKAIELDGIMVNNSVEWNAGRETFFLHLSGSDFETICSKHIKISFLDYIIEFLKKIYYWNKRFK